MHCVLPLLYWHLKTIGQANVPPDVWRQLQSYFHQNTTHNFRLTRELLKLVAFLHERDIAVAPLKGPALAAAAYGNLSLRQFADLDILVHKRDILKVKELLLDHGYRLQVPLTKDQEAAHLQDDSVYDLVRNDGQVPLEIHWGITAPCIPFPLDLDRLDGRLQTIDLAGAAMPNIAAEETLIILCVHGTKHIWGRLAWICDVAELLRSHPDLDWKRVLDQAQVLRVRRMVALGLLLAQDVLSAHLPPEVVEWLASERTAQSLALRVRQRLFAEENPSRVEDDIFILQAMEGVPARLLYSLHLAVTPSSKERAMIALPSALNFLWYFIRPARLIAKYGLRATTSFFNRSASQP